MYLVGHVKIGSLFRTLDSPRKTGLSAESSSVGGCDEEGL